MSLGYIFNEAKATEAAAYILSLNNRRLPYLKLIKLLYISDRRFLTDYHDSITTSSYYSMKYGPVTSEILDHIRHPQDYDENGYWNSTIRTEEYDAVLKGKVEALFLSDAERDVLASVDNQYKSNERFSLADFTHTLPEWKNPGNSRCPLTIEDILDATIQDEAERKKAEDDIMLSSHIQAINLNSGIKP